MKKILFSLALTFSATLGLCQQFSLYNSLTLYDAFENPSQKAFQADSSRKYAFNLFVPTVSINGTFSGQAQNTFKSLIRNAVVDARNLTLGQGEINTLTAHSNNYILMFRIFRNVDYNSEFGFSWQIRNDGRLNITNETIALIDDYRRFENENQYQNILNNNGYNQSYNQYSFSYREDFTKRLSLGVKLSLLSGITYNKLDIKQSTLNIRRNLDEYDMIIKGNLKSSFVESDLNSGIINPTFSDPGLSISLGSSYKFKGGWFLMTSVKDMGFIKWNKNSYNYDLNDEVKIDNASLPSADERLKDSTLTLIKSIRKTGSYTTLINGKAEALINKDYGNYQPNLIVSKNLFYPGGHVAFVNNYKLENLIFTATADYNLDKYLHVGGQFMIKTPNVEFFLGSDQLLQTFKASRSLFNDKPELGNSYSGASAYFGFALKFGPVMEHQANSNFIPGMNKDYDKGGLFRRLIGN